MKKQEEILNLTEKGEHTKMKLKDNTDIALPSIETMIMNIRGEQVMLDRDLAKLYGVETKVLNQAVRRNLDRFPPHFRFQLTKEEVERVVTNCDHLLSIKYLPVLPYGFTEQGVAMLSTVLHSKTAVAVSIQIMDAFVAMRRFISNNVQLAQRIEDLEYSHSVLFDRQNRNEDRIEELFQRFEHDILYPQQGIFYEGQIFDAYTFATDLIKSARSRIILIDNFIDESVLLMLSKRMEGVDALIVTRKITNTLKLDLARHQQQYPPVNVQQSQNFHDRFLIIDDKVYHLGASLKDLGKKLFAFSKMEMPVKKLGIED